MENPKEETPIAIQEPEVEEKRPFFTVGKILAIFGVLLIVGTIVGAVMYSRSSERFKGELTSSADMAGRNSLSDTLVTSTDEPVDSGIIVCDESKNWEQATADFSGATSCLCEYGYGAFSPNDTCVKIDYCNTTKDELSKYASSNYLYPDMIEEIRTIINDFDNYIATNCVEEKALECPDFLEKLTMGDGTEYCMCEDGHYPLLSQLTETAVTSNFAGTPSSCQPFNCDLTDEQVAKATSDVDYILSFQNLIDAVKNPIITKFKEDYKKYEDEQCVETVEDEQPARTVTTTTKEVLECPDPLDKLTYPVTGTLGVEYCMCAAGTYPVITISGDSSLATAATQTTVTVECEPFECNLTDEKLKKIIEDITYILGQQSKWLRSELAESILSDFKSEYEAYNKSDECYVPPVKAEPTCEDLKKELGYAYYAEARDKYDEILMLMQNTTNCIEPCEFLFYSAVGQLSRGNVAEARKYIDQYLKKCTDECTLTYGMLSLYAETLSKLDQVAPTLNALNVSKVTDADLAILKAIVTKYIENCQCFEIESFLIDPGFPAEDYFGPESTLQMIDTLDRLPTNNDTSTVRSVNNNLRTAYAQSSATLSPLVRGVIEDVYNDLCVPEKTPDKPESCKTLTIMAPSPTGTYVMSRDFNPTMDDLKFKVDNDELVTGYKISSGTVTFDGNAKTVNVAKTKTEVSMSGGPVKGSEDVIRVVALEGGSDVTNRLVAPKETCSAELKLVRPMDPPPTTKTDPVCRSLEIISPIDAAEPEVPTIELASGTYVNKVLEIKVSADAGSVKDYKYESAKGYITFNGQETLYTTDKTVVMDGIIPKGETDTVSVWARDPDLKGIQACNDGYIITVPKKETPPPTEEVPPPPVTTTEEVPPPPIEEIVIPITPTTPVVVTAPVHSAAPEAPQTGPGMLIYLVGAGLGGALLRRKK